MQLHITKISYFAWFVFILFFFLFHCRCPRNWKTSEPDTHSRPRGTLDFLDMQGPLNIHGPFPHEASASLLCSQSQWCLQEVICPFCPVLLSAVCMVCGSLNTCSGLKGLCLLLMWRQVLGLQLYDHSCIQSRLCWCSWGSMHYYLVCENGFKVKTSTVHSALWTDINKARRRGRQRFRNLYRNCEAMYVKGCLSQGTPWNIEENVWVISSLSPVAHFSPQSAFTERHTSGSSAWNSGWSHLVGNCQLVTVSVYNFLPGSGFLLSITGAQHWSRRLLIP